MIEDTNYLISKRPPATKIRCSQSPTGYSRPSQPCQDMRLLSICRVSIKVPTNHQSRPQHITRPLRIPIPTKEPSLSFAVAGSHLYSIYSHHILYILARRQTRLDSPRTHILGLVRDRRRRHARTCQRAQRLRAACSTMIPAAGSWPL